VVLRYQRNPNGSIGKCRRPLQPGGNVLVGWPHSWSEPVIPAGSGSTGKRLLADRFGIGQHGVGAAQLMACEETQLLRRIGPSLVSSPGSSWRADPPVSEPHVLEGLQHPQVSSTFATTERLLMVALLDDAIGIDE